MPDLIVAGGTIVSGGELRRADLHVSNGRVVTDRDMVAEGADVVDATGMYVLPGMVDTHVHLMDPGDTTREDFPTGTRAAAVAGVTTIIEHTHSDPVRSLTDLDAKVAYLEGRANVDFGLAAHVWPDRLDDLGPLWRGGISYFKIFTCTTHGVPGLVGARLKDALERIAALGARCLIHCEDEDMTSEAERRLRDAGREDNGILLEWRSREAEERAVDEVCRLVGETGAIATIAHVSNPHVADMVATARSGGADIAAEACPQYFALREDEVLTQGPLRKFTPPARARSVADEDAMWDRLRSGALTHVSTDHAPSNLEQKSRGIWDSPFGLPGIDTTAPFLIDAALAGRLELVDVARVYSEAPARRYGLYPRKGHLGVGADGDLSIVDPEATWDVVDEEIISKAGWTPFHGRVFKGRVLATFLRGTKIASNRVPADARGGEFLSGAGARPS